MGLTQAYQRIGGSPRADPWAGTNILVQYTLKEMQAWNCRLFSMTGKFLGRPCAKGQQATSPCAPADVPLTSIGSLLCAHSRSSPLAPDLSHVAVSTTSTTHPLPPLLHGLIPTGRRRSDGAITGKRTRRSSTVGRPTSCHFSLSLPILALGNLSASLLSFPTRCTRTHGRVIGTSMDHDFTTTVFVEGGGASPASAPLGQAASSFHTPSLASSAPLLTLLFLSSPLS